MENSSRSWMRKMAFFLFISILITIIHIEATQATRILKTKSSRANEFSAEPENSGIEILKNKLPSGPSPGSGNAIINDGGVKIGVNNITLLKDKLPSGGSPGTGNAFINNGGVKSGWRNVSILKNKLPSGESPGTGH